MHIYLQVLDGLSLSFFKILFIHFQTDGNGGIKRDRNISMWSPTGDLACNPGMFSDWESNWQPPGLQAGTQSTKQHQPRQLLDSLNLTLYHYMIIFFFLLLQFWLKISFVLYNYSYPCSSFCFHLHIVSFPILSCGACISLKVEVSLW